MAGLEEFEGLRGLEGRGTEQLFAQLMNIAASKKRAWEFDTEIAKKIQSAEKQGYIDSHIKGIAFGHPLLMKAVLRFVESQGDTPKYPTEEVMERDGEDALGIIVIQVLQDCVACDPKTRDNKFGLDRGERKVDFERLLLGYDRKVLNTDKVIFALENLTGTQDAEMALREAGI